MGLLRAWNEYSFFLMLSVEKVLPTAINISYYPLRKFQRPLAFLTKYGILPGSERSFTFYAFTAWTVSVTPYGTVSSLGPSVSP